MRFSSVARVVFDFQASLDKSEIQQAIMDIEYVGKGTATGAALDTAREGLILPEQSLVGRRDDVKTVVLVVTDGATLETSEVLAAAAAAMHETGAVTFALGITDSVNLSELAVIASSPQNVVTVNDLEAAGAEEFIRGLVLQIACDEAPTTALP